MKRGSTGFPGVRAGTGLFVVAAAAGVLAATRGWPEAALAWFVSVALLIVAVSRRGETEAPVAAADALADRLEQARRDGRFTAPMAAVVVELRGLAADTLVDGSAAWSQPLAIIARRLVAADLGQQLHLARLGPHTFGAVFRCADHADAIAAGEALVALCRVPVPVDTREVQVDAVAGVRHAPVGERATGEELLREADAAMRVDGNAASPVAGVDERLIRHARRVVEVESEIRHSLDVDLLTARLFPVVDVRQDGLVGLRSAYDWTSVSKAEPETLRAIAGSLGLRRSLETQYLMRSMIAADSIPDVGGRRVVATIEPTRLCDPRAVGQIALLLEACGLDPDNLVLEIDAWGAANLDRAAVRLLDEIGVGVGLSLRYRNGWDPVPNLLVDRFESLAVQTADLLDPEDGGLLVSRIDYLEHITAGELDRITVMGVDHAPFALELSSAGLVRQAGMLHGQQMTAAELRRWLVRRTIG